MKKFTIILIILLTCILCLPALITTGAAVGDVTAVVDASAGAGAGVGADAVGAGAVAAAVGVGAGASAGAGATAVGADTVDGGAGEGGVSSANTANRLYGIGSVSKMFTTAAVMKLAEEGKLDIDEPLTAYISDFIMADDRYALITPRMLLNHSSGLMGTTSVDAFLIGDNDTYLHDHILELLKTQTLKHDPGDRSIYCNDGFTLAEILIERVGGMTYTEYIAKNFSEPLGLENVKTPQSDFDRNRLAYTYLGNNELKPESLGMIGTGGIYATVEDLCRFAEIFMDGSDGSILSKASTAEMAKPQHKMEIAPLGRLPLDAGRLPSSPTGAERLSTAVAGRMPQDAGVLPAAARSDTVFRYGLGWDCVDPYPFNQYGIRALSKGGATQSYFANLTVLPEHNLAAAVTASGTGGLESLIAQEILLAVLEEEGLIPTGSTIEAPGQNMNRAIVPEDIKQRAGVYAVGLWGQYGVEFTAGSLFLMPIGARNERPMEFVYNTDGEFISTNGDFMGLNSAVPGAVGVTALSFADDYLMLRTYENIPGLSHTAEALPIAEKIAENPVSGDAWSAWMARNDKEYLLVSEKYTSRMYIDNPNVKTLADERAYGYVMQGVYDAGGVPFPAARIMDGQTAAGYQNTPIMTGRDITDLSVMLQGGAEFLHLNNHRYIETSAATPFSALGETVVVGDETVWAYIDDGFGDETVWAYIDDGLGGKTVGVTTPENGSWFVYDAKMNCVATSLEKNLRTSIILPENGRLAFAGEPGAAFTLQYLY